MRLETSEITDTTREARTFCEMAGGVPVSFHPVLFQSKIDHRPQKQCGRERMLSCERIRGGRQDLVVIAVQLLGTSQDECGSLLQRGP
jgi:hypothetical protein